MSAQDYTISPARYAKGHLAVHCKGNGSGYKDRAERLIGDGLNCRWTGREKAYIASPSKAAKFERLYAAGYSACVMSGAVYHPHRPAQNMSVKEALLQIDARGDSSASQHPSSPAAVKLRSTPATRRGASEAGNGATIEPDPSSMEKDGHPHSMEKPGRSPARERLLRRYLAMRAERAAHRERRDAIIEATHGWARSERARKRLARRGVTMRQRAELDRLALLAAGDFVRQADAERDAANVAATLPPTHLDQAPGYGVIAQMHRERDAAAAKLAEADGREAALKRMVERLSDEIGQLSGRAIRAEQALQVYRVPVLAITDQRDPRSVEMQEAGR